MLQAKVTSILILSILALPIIVSGADVVPVPRPFDPPALTEFKPEDCRSVPANNPVLGNRNRFRSSHADAVNSDEVSIAPAPVIQLKWIAEADKYFPSAATFDKQGDMYVSPLWPGEQVILIALNGKDGSRRWVIPGTGLGLFSLVTDDPEQVGEEIIFHSTYSETLAVRPNGTILWRKPSGLVPPPGKELELPYLSWGTNYHPGADAVVAVTGDGYLYALDRKTGEPVLSAPYQLPGEKTPPGTPTPLPPPVEAVIDKELLPLIPTAPYQSFQGMVDAITGRNSEVANAFAIDPRTGRMWVAATAPDEADGKKDGISEYGALYGLDIVVGDGPPFAIAEHCRIFFQGGSASTPSLDQKGQRIYLGDGGTNLFAIDNDCQEVWRLNTGAQILGSVGVAADKHELYVLTGRNMLKVVDEGSQGTIVWTSVLDMYEVPTGQFNFNLLTPGVGATGVFILGGAGQVAIRPDGSESMRPFKVGVGLLDRQTGRLRYFVDGREESVATMPIAPDGSVVLTHSPLRRALARGIAEATPSLKGKTLPLIGGVAKYGVSRADLLVRDAVCAAADRAANAFAYRDVCSDSAEADVTQIGELIAQALAAGEKAVADGELTGAAWKEIQKEVEKAAQILEVPTLNVVATHLDKACAYALNKLPPPIVPAITGLGLGGLMLLLAGIAVAWRRL